MTEIPLRILVVLFAAVELVATESSTSPEPVTTTPETTLPAGFCEGCAEGTAGPCKVDGGDLCLGFINPLTQMCAPNMTRCATSQCPCRFGTGPCINDDSELCLPYIADSISCPDSFHECFDVETPGVTSCSPNICMYDTSGDCYQPDSGLCLPFMVETTQECYPNTLPCGGGIPCLQCNFGTQGPCRHPDSGFCAPFVPGTLQCQTPLQTCSLTSAPSVAPSNLPTMLPTITECINCDQGAGQCRTDFGEGQPVLCYPTANSGDCAEGLVRC